MVEFQATVAASVNAVLADHPVVALISAGVVVPIGGGLTRLSVPPRVKLPELVTVPVNVKPLTVPVPPTEVTVPAPVPAPIAVLNVAASKDETVLSALNLGNVIALGLVIVKMFAPSVVAPKLVRAFVSVVAPVPPLATGNAVPE